MRTFYLEDMPRWRLKQVKIPKEVLHHSGLFVTVAQFTFNGNTFQSLDSNYEFIDIKTGEIVKIFPTR